MFNIGFSELLLLGVLGLIFIHPKDLPALARTVGRFLNDLKNASDEAFSSIRGYEDKAKSFLNSREQQINDMATKIMEVADTSAPSEKKPQPRPPEDRGNG